MRLIHYYVKTLFGSRMVYFDIALTVLLIKTIWTHWYLFRLIVG